MTFDDGFHLGMTSDDDFRAKFCSLWKSRGISFASNCERAGVSQDEARRAIEEGTYGLPQNSVILQRLLAVFGLDLSWLLNGPATHSTNVEERKRELFELVFEFCFRNEVPKSHRKALMAHEMRKLDDAPPNSLMIAARAGIARNMTDLAYTYKDLLRRGVIREEGDDGLFD